jgi:hypothetical protein
MRLLAISFMLLFFGQQNAPATVSGIVVKQGTDEVLSRVTVLLYQDRENIRLDASRSPLASTTTGTDGKFAFPNVTPGQYRISATRNGYVRAEYGDRSSNGCGTPVSLIAGQKMENARIAMLPAGVISGRLVDADREGIPGVSAHALKYVYENGRRIFNVVQTVQTNDLGEYRLYGLTPGRYYVAAALESTKSLQREVIRLPDTPFIPAPSLLPPGANPAPAPQPGPTVFEVPVLDPAPGDRYFPTYYPGVRDPMAARAIDLRPGESAPGTELTVTLAQTVSVTGKIVSNSRGNPSTVSVTLLPRLAHPGAGTPLRTSPVKADGTFQLSSVIPGAYYLVVSGADSGGRLTGRTSVDVGNKALEDVVIEAARGFELNGRVTVDDPKVMARLISVALTSLNPVSSVSASSNVSGNISQADGSFRLQGITAGDYIPFVSFMSNAGRADIYVKALRLGAQDVRDGIRLDTQPAGLLELVIGNNGAAVEGTVVNDKQVPVPGATVVLVPDVFLRKRGSLYKTRTTDASGHFRLDAIGPGDYKVFAWEEVENGAWQDPDFIRIHETRGKALTLREGSTEQVQLALIPSSGSIYGQCEDPLAGFR